MGPATVSIRPRRDADADALVAALALVQKSDAYPIEAAHVEGPWLFGPDVSAAWTALVDELPVGHVAVVRGFGTEQTSEALGRPAADTLGLTRFFVSPDARGTGAGTGLLQAVDDYATEAGSGLALEVAEHNTAAQALYERRGWRRVGEYAAQWFGPQGPHPIAYLYVKVP